MSNFKILIEEKFNNFFPILTQKLGIIKPKPKIRVDTSIEGPAMIGEDGNLYINPEIIQKNFNTDKAVDGLLIHEIIHYLVHYSSKSYDTLIFEGNVKHQEQAQKFVTEVSAIIHAIDEFEEETYEYTCCFLLNEISKAKEKGNATISYNNHNILLLIFLAKKFSEKRREKIKRLSIQLLKLLGCLT